MENNTKTTKMGDRYLIDNKLEPSQVTTIILRCIDEFMHSNADFLYIESNNLNIIVRRNSQKTERR